MRNDQMGDSSVGMKRRVTKLEGEGKERLNVFF